MLVFAGCHCFLTIRFRTAALVGSSGPAGPEHPLASQGHPVVYASGTEEQFHLWLMAEDGSDPVQLTRGDGAELGPVWSPDGSRIAFVAAIDMADDFDLWMIDADGTDYVS